MLTFSLTIAFMQNDITNHNNSNMKLNFNHRKDVSCRHLNYVLLSQLYMKRYLDYANMQLYKHVFQNDKKYLLYVLLHGNHVCCCFVFNLHV